MPSIPTASAHCRRGCGKARAGGTQAGEGGTSTCRCLTHICVCQETAAPDHSSNMAPASGEEHQRPSPTRYMPWSLDFFKASFTAARVRSVGVSPLIRRAPPPSWLSRVRAAMLPLLPLAPPPARCPQGCQVCSCRAWASCRQAPAAGCEAASAAAAHDKAGAWHACPAPLLVSSRLKDSCTARLAMGAGLGEQGDAALWCVWLETGQHVLSDTGWLY